MRLNANILYLPTSIVLLLALHSAATESSAEEQSPAQWPKHVRYWPEDPSHRRRDLEALQEHVRRGESPVGIMKMSSDPGEKFYMEYWQYEGEVGQSRLSESGSLRTGEEEEEAEMLANVSMTVAFKAPFALHTEDRGELQELRARAAIGRSATALAGLEKRAFTCPTGTSSCSAIGYPNSCCPATETCFQIQDTGLGPVGCCPNGNTCGGTITVCNAPNSACPQSLGGGCCIPNYVCAGVGCVINVVTTVVLTQALSTSASSTSIRTTTAVTAVIPPVPVPTSVSSSSTQTTLVCRSDSNPCPISLGGGCCHTDRVCASSLLCALPPGSSESTTTTTEVPSPTASTTATGGAPVRPTSDTSATTGPTITTDCPVYFYACSARYGGGCCQTGRDCAVTSCPPTSSTTIISEGRTVVVPVGPAATVNTPTGECAPSWSTCAPSLGGNCCPQGWQCGTASCSTVGPSATVVEQKQSPNAGSMNKVSSGLIVVGVTVLVMFMI